MPIGDLLAQIRGDKSTAGSAPELKRTNSVPVKRKPDGDLRGDASKTPRRTTSAEAADKPTSYQQPYTGSSRPGNTPVSRGPKPTQRAANPALASRPAPVVAAAPPKAPPKKGSFAEILARGQRAQAAMGQVGKIQHKKVEKGAIKKSRDEPPAAAPPKSRTTGGYTGTAKPGQRNGVNDDRPSAKGSRDSRQGVAARPPAGRGKAATGASSAAAEEEAAKKFKKAAQATTGYTGTARPKPGTSARKDAPRGGALLNAPRHGASKNSRYEDDYDEELDDFIEYDDDEDEGGPRYDYDSEGSSDMEAGLDDIDSEERRAEFIGRREDQAEERLEKTLKAAKEERKRKALEALRAKRH